MSDDLTTEEKIDKILDTMERVETMIRTVVAEVGPTVEALMKHPMLKMFLK